MLEERRELLEASLDNWKRELARKRKLKKDYEPPAAELKKRDTMEQEVKALAAKKTTLHGLLENPRAERPFFLWHLWFRHILSTKPGGRGGFDIVIANPPYVRQESIKEQKPALKAEPYECFDGVADLLVYFYECAVKKLRPGGVLTFITSNKYYRAGYGEALRGFLSRELTLHRLTDFGDAPVFDAIAYASILEGTRTAPTAAASAKVYTWEKEVSLDCIASVIEARGQPILQKELTPDGWRLASPAVLKLLAKLKAKGTPLGEYVKGRGYWGIKTGLNEAFVIDRATRDRLISEHKSSSEILKPFLRGRDVKRWCVDSQDMWLIFTRRGINIEEYPAVKHYLSQFKKQLMPGTPGGRKPGTYEWFEIQDNIAYWEEFSKPKLVVPAISGTVNVALEKDGFFTNNKTSIFVCENAPYVCAIVNSSVAFWFARQVFATKQGNFFDFETRYSSQWPIPAATAAEELAITGLVESILVAQGKGNAALVKRLEQEIDTRVYRLYNLTCDEVKIVEENAK